MWFLAFQVVAGRGCGFRFCVCVSGLDVGGGFVQFSAEILDVIAMVYNHIFVGYLNRFVLVFRITGAEDVYV